MATAHDHFIDPKIPGIKSIHAWISFRVESAHVGTLVLQTTFEDGTSTKRNVAAAEPYAEDAYAGVVREVMNEERKLRRAANMGPREINDGVLTALHIVVTGANPADPRDGIDGDSFDAAALDFFNDYRLVHYCPDAEDTTEAMWTVQALMAWRDEH